MEKESVLEIEFVPVLGKWAWRITKQNEEVLKFGSFTDYEIGVSSTLMISPTFVKVSNFLFLKAYELDKGVVNICNDEIKNEIEEKVRCVNEKYGIVKRWRAKTGGKYFYIDDYCEISIDDDWDYDEDKARYLLGIILKQKKKLRNI